MAWTSPVTSQGMKDSLLFIGSLHYPPNRDGLVWFLRDVWPTILATQPDMQLRVVGEGPRGAGRWMKGPRVSWVGYVSDLTPEYNRAVALVNPIRYGTGTRRKILGAWAAGVPVVSTTRGAQGLDYINQEHLLLADAADEFASAVRILRESPETWHRLNRAGWEHARNRYDSLRAWGVALHEILAEHAQ